MREGMQIFRCKRGSAYFGLHGNRGRGKMIPIIQTCRMPETPTEQGVQSNQEALLERYRAAQANLVAAQSALRTCALQLLSMPQDESVRNIFKEHQIDSQREKRVRYVSLGIALADADFLPSDCLVELEEKLNQGNVRSLTDSSLALRLEALNASFSQLEECGMQLLTTLTNLKLLELTDSHIDNDNGVVSLQGLSSLVCLGLSNTGIGDVGIRALVANLPQLQEFDVSHNRMTNAGAVLLRKFSSLQSLNIGATRVHDDGMKSVAQMSGLRRLDLSENIVSDRGLEHIGAMENLTDLRLCDLRQVTSEGMRPIARLAGLQRLDLNYTNIGSTGLQHLVGLSRLKKLNIAHTGIDQNSFSVLQRLPQLRTLIISGGAISVAQLRVALPNCEIIFR